MIGKTCCVRALLAAFVALAALSPARAAEVKGQVFEERASVDGTSLELCAVSLLRWKWVLDVYVMGLYLESCDDLPKKPQGETARRLEIAYLRGFSGPQFADAADQVLERTFDAKTLEPLRERIAKLHAAYQAVEKGDRYALTFTPGRGTELAKNGKALAAVPGADFADVYFDIWLGDDPADGGLRDRLLRGERK